MQRSKAIAGLSFLGEDLEIAQQALGTRIAGWEITAGVPRANHPGNPRGSSGAGTKGGLPLHCAADPLKAAAFGRKEDS